MLSDQVKDIASKIGAFYLRKNNGDYTATEKEIVDLRIMKIEVAVNKAVVITIGRPGLLIGKRGTNVDALSKFLQTEIKIIEDMDNLHSWLVPVDYRDEY